mmetsp:Transcript_8398/g.18073  ORF Transcript_8398/g.18073 Transcript_8398/m.18073 type:complete len:85 (+) Transcript_8398:144-398(+)
MCITVLFNLYIRQTHFRVAKYLPARDCLKADLDRDPDFDFDFLRGAYLQPQLKAERELRPNSSISSILVDEQQETFEMDPSLSK